MTEPIPLSPSSIRDLSCPHKFRELRVLNRWPKQRAQSTFIANGRAAHAVFCDVFNPVYGPNPPHRHRLDAAVSRAVAGEHYPDSVSRKLACEWIRSVVPVYLDQHDTARTVLAVEQSASFNLYHQGQHVAQVRARLDRVEVNADDPDTLVIVDLAFGNKSLTPHQAWMALAVGKHVYKSHGFSRHHLEIHHIDSEEVTVTLWRGSDVKSVHLEVGALAAAFLAANTSGTVQAQIGEPCQYCPLVADRRCPAQKAVNLEELSFEDEEAGAARGEGVHTAAERSRLA